MMRRSLPHEDLGEECSLQREDGVGTVGNEKKNSNAPGTHEGKKELAKQTDARSLCRMMTD